MKSIDRSAHHRITSARWRLPVLGLVATGLVALMLPGLAGASPKAKKPLTPLQQSINKGKAFYRGQTITLGIAGPVASTFDNLARVLAPFMSTYLHASFAFSELGTLANPAAMDIIAAYPPTGLQGGIMQLSQPEIQEISGVNPGLNFNILREAWINTNVISPNVIVATTASGISSFQQIIKSQTPVKVLTSSSASLGNIFLRTMLGVTGAKVSYVTGYSSTPTTIQGLERGDGSVANVALASAEPLIQGGLVKPLAISIKAPVGMLGRASVLGTPSFSQILRQYAPKTKKAQQAAAALEFIVTGPNATLTFPTGVSEYKVDALRTAANWAYQQPTFKSQMLADALVPTLLDPVQAKAAFAATAKGAGFLSCYLNGTPCS